MTKTTELPLIVHLLALGGASYGFSWVKGKLDSSYLASNHPVDYVTGQTSFNGTMIKGYYQHMQDAGGLGQYWVTQFIDFGFICAVFCLGLLLSTLLARSARHGSIARKLAMLAGMSVMLGAGFDVLENLISFIMLADALQFPDWVAYPYSAAASLKFALITAGMFGMVGSVALNVIGRSLPHRLKQRAIGAAVANRV